MSWKGVTVMNQRVRFIAEHLKGYFSFAELCRQFSVSRKTGYKWVQRYSKYGAEGLNDRARRPHTCPHKTDPAIIEAIVQVRMKHPSWGPKKILEIIRPQAAAAAKVGRLSQGVDTGIRTPRTDKGNFFVTYFA